MSARPRFTVAVITGGAVTTGAGGFAQPEAYVYDRLDCFAIVRRLSAFTREEALRRARAIAAHLNENRPDFTPDGRRIVPEAPHGTEYGYNSFGCRCDDCSEVGRHTSRARKAARRDAS